MIKNKLKFREATLSDYNLVLGIQKNDGFKHAYYLDIKRYEILLQRGEVFYLVFNKQDDCIGFASIDFEVRAKLHFLSVAQKYQMKGVGISLINHLIKVTKEKGYKYIYVYVEKYSPVEKFLTSNGFQKVGYVRKRYKGKRDANILQIDL